jgi:membrane associated rhomboid family serine protease
MRSGPDATRSTEMRPSIFHRHMLVLCVAAFFAQIAYGVELSIAEFGLYGPAVPSEPWRVLTAGFLHVGVLHLVMNMLALVVLGRTLEPLYAAGGIWRFPVLYLGSLLAGSVGALILEWGSYGVGASGAVFGLMGAAMSLPRKLGLGWNALGVAPWVGLNLVITFAIPGISAGGHLGGLVAGLVLGWVLTPDLHDAERISGPSRVF